MLVKHSRYALRRSLHTLVPQNQEFSGILKIERIPCVGRFMYTLELNLKQMPIPLSVQKKAVEDAKADYDRIVAALKSGSSTLIELTCEQVPDKKVSLLSGEVVAVQMYEKSGTTAASGKPPGFFSLVGEQ
jgi:hypothetical protein